MTENYARGVRWLSEDSGPSASQAEVMATFSTSGDMLTVRLTRRERVAAARGDLRVPLAAIRDVQVHPDALAAARGVRAPRVVTAGRAELGIWRGRGRRDFIVARRGVPALCVSLDGGRHHEVIVSTPDAEAIADEIRTRAPRLRADS